MAKYRFICQNCKKEVEKITSSKVEEMECNICKDKMLRQFPSAGSKRVTEVVDSYTNVRNEEDQKQNTKARRTEYFWEVEVPRLVQTYSLQTCLEEGWLVYNEKGELVTGKSPSKR